MVRLRSAPTTQQPAITAAQTKRPALKEKTNTTRTRPPVYEGDGNTEGLVKDARPRRGRAKAVVQAEEEFTMAGGLGAASDSKTSDRSAPPPTTDDLAKSDGPPPPTAKANRRPPPRMARKTVRSEADSNVLEGVKKRMQATAPTQAAARRKQLSLVGSEQAATSSDSLPTKPPPPRKPIGSVVERSEFSISPSPPPPGKLHPVNKQRSSLVQPGSALRSTSTPAVESSILALKNFKRRPRQPSMLQMVQQRTASARPSLSNARAAESDDVYDLEVGDDDIDDFAPEAEGTPVHLKKKAQKPKASSKRASDLQHVADNVSSSCAKRKRKSTDVDVSHSSLEALHAKRRKPAPIEDENYQEPIVTLQRSVSVQQTSPARAASSTPKLDADVQVNNSFTSSTPPTEPSSPARVQPIYDDGGDFVVPSTEKDNDEPQYVPLNDLEDPEPGPDPDGTMAEPVSSSPIGSEPPVDTQRTDIMAEPLTQLSPPRPQRDKPKATAKKKKPAPVTTAALQDLLPKRRQPLKPRHRKSEYDIDSASDEDDPLDASHLENDEDELGGKLRRQTKSKTQAKGKKGKPSAAAKTKPRPSKSAAPTKRKSSVAPPPRKSTSANKPTRMYGRAAPATSDKENNDDGNESPDENNDSLLPDISLSMYEAARSKELEAAKKKFAKVDEWDMEFESMSVEEHRSSSQGWR